MPYSDWNGHTLQEIWPDIFRLESDVVSTIDAVLARHQEARDVKVNGVCSWCILTNFSSCNPPLRTLLPTRLQVTTKAQRTKHKSHTTTTTMSTNNNEWDSLLAPLLGNLIFNLCGTGAVKPSVRAILEALTKKTLATSAAVAEALNGEGWPPVLRKQMQKVQQLFHEETASKVRNTLLHTTARYDAYRTVETWG